MSRKSTLFAGFALLLGAAHAHAQDHVPDRQRIEERALERERALGLQRVPVGPGEFRYHLPPGLETPETREEKGLIWLYDGQHVFTEDTSPPVARLIRLEPEPRRSRAEKLLGTVEVDRFGRRWMVAGVDDDALDEAVAAYDARVAEAFGLEPGHRSEPALGAASDEDPEDEGWVRWFPETWYGTNCDSDSTVEIRRWDSDGRKESSNPMTTRQKKVVIVTSPRGSGSGVLVDSNTVLTAAHVICNSSGSRYSASSISVMTLGNYQSGAKALSAHSTKIASGYSGDGDMSDDYALICLDDSAGVGWMAISSASNSTIKSATSYSSGYPGFGPGCTSTSESPIHSGYAASTQYWGKGDLFGTTSKRIKTKLDGGPGHSGGPFYYYPSGCCGAHYVTGLVSGYVTVALGTNYRGGPKGSAIRSWVIANM